MIPPDFLHTPWVLLVALLWPVKALAGYLLYRLWRFRRAAALMKEPPR